MKRFAALCPVLGMCIVLAGCASMGRQPRLDNAAITPSTLHPTETGVISVKVVDKYKIVNRVVGTVVEDPRMKFRLRDDGRPPDEKALDGIWSVQVEVPKLAPPGNFTIELTAYDSKGNAIEVKKARREKGPLTATTAMVIEYPPDAPDEAVAPAPTAQSQQ
jgi:hypothetical protein